jgi:CHAT domain-containing protein
MRVSRRAILKKLIAAFQARLGEYAASEKNYQKHAALVEEYHRLKPRAPEFDATGLVHMEHAELLASQGRFSEALVLAKKARMAFAPGGPTSANIQFQTLGWKPAYLEGVYLEKLGRKGQAEDAYRASIVELESLYGKMRSGRVKGAFLRVKECGEVYRHLVSLLIARGATEEALGFLERSKSTALLDKLRSLPVRDRSRWPKDLLERERVLKQQIRQLKGGREATGMTPTGARSGGTRVTTNSVTLPEVRWQFELLMREIEGLTDQMVSGDVPVDHVMHTDPRKILKVGEGLPGRLVVSYFHDQERFHCFTLREGKLKVYTLGPLGKIRKQASRLRRRVTGRSRRWIQPAKRLHEYLVGPWDKELVGVDELILIPTDFLYSLPFACLLDSQGTPLAEVVSLSMASQASLLRGEKETKAVEDAVWRRRLVVADPDGSLPSARTEAAGILSLCEDPTECTLLQGEVASESKLKQLLGFLSPRFPPGIVHLATHGLLETSRDLFSSLVLAPDAVEDGALTVGEIYNELDLRSAPVVILSACNTGMGGEEGGDEILGLSRAFQYAGAPWVVASLWEVSDVASSDLMRRFHASLSREHRVDRALSEAMRATRTVREDWGHPFYWAAFTAFRR